MNELKDIANIQTTIDTAWKERKKQRKITDELNVVFGACVSPVAEGFPSLSHLLSPMHSAHETENKERKQERWNSLRFNRFNYLTWFWGWVWGCLIMCLQSFLIYEKDYHIVLNKSLQFVKAQSYRLVINVMGMMSLENSTHSIIINIITMYWHTCRKTSDFV